MSLSRITKSTWIRNIETDKIQVLFVLNIIPDVLQEREPFYDFSARLMALAETGSIQGWLAAHSVTTLFYRIAMVPSLPPFVKIGGISGLLSVIPNPFHPHETCFVRLWRDFFTPLSPPQQKSRLKRRLLHALGGT